MAEPTEQPVSAGAATIKILAMLAKAILDQANGKPLTVEQREVLAAIIDGASEWA